MVVEKVRGWGLLRTGPRLDIRAISCCKATVYSQRTTGVSAWGVQGLYSREEVRL